MQAWNDHEMSLPLGSITLEDVITVLPWGQNIGIVHVNGSVIMEALEWAVHNYEETLTGHVSTFLQVSGW